MVGVIRLTVLQRKFEKLKPEARSKKVKEKDLPISPSRKILALLVRCHQMAERVSARPTFGGFSLVNIGKTGFESF